ncbi:MAG: site-specific integrase [Tannerellaceae bacterium]|nr:site-specific integrase [Tannerellaceae bacterium]
MANYYPYIKPKYVNKDGVTPLYVRYNYDRTRRTLIATGFSVDPKYWDEKRCWIKKACPQYDEIDMALTKITSKLGRILSFAKDNFLEPTIEFVLLELDKDREYEQRPGRLNMFDLLDEYIEEKKTKVSADQIKDYKNLKKHLTNFKPYSSQPISFRNLNLKFYNEFMDYLFYKAVKPDGTVGLLTNSAGKVVRLLKGFVNYQMAKGTIPPINLKVFKVVEEETDANYLNERELDILYSLDLSYDKELEEIRDVFIIGCYTGLRYSDLSTLGIENIDFINENITLSNNERYIKP